MNLNFENALRTVSTFLDRKGIKWALIGSTNMQLQGMNVSPRDLDIVVQLNDLYRVHEIFSEYEPTAVTKLPPMTGEPGWEVKMNIEGVEVQILGEKNTGEYVSKLINGRIKKITVDNFRVTCFALDAEAQAYAETKREHKAELIRAFLKGK